MLKILKVKSKAPRLASGTSPIWKGHAWTFLSQDKSLLSQDETLVSERKTHISWDAPLLSQDKTLVSQEGSDLFVSGKYCKLSVSSLFSFFFGQQMPIVITVTVKRARWYAWIPWLPFMSNKQGKRGTRRPKKNYLQRYFETFWTDYTG